MLIGSTQVLLAQDRVRITGQEHRIAEMQADFAEATADFLANKFTNYHLYDWMSNILEGVYSFFLQQATAIAKLAENQLAFERQQVPPPYIRDDYWEDGGIGRADHDPEPIRVGRRRYNDRQRRECMCSFGPLCSSDLQFLLARWAIDTLGVYRPAFATQQNGSLRYPYRTRLPALRAGEDAVPLANPFGSCSDCPVAQACDPPRNPPLLFLIGRR